VTTPVNVGDVLAGKYRVERVLGRGGMGVVVGARHLHLGETFAIKLLLPEALRDGALVARFLREGRAAAKVRSEHVARVYDVGTLDDGAPFIVMEHLEGSDLREVLKARGRLPVEEAVGYVLQACAALAEAHALGIVHRDIKPANLFVVTRPDESILIKVIDFGISKFLFSESGAEMDLTETLEPRGSPLFMSPEQLGGSRAIDARSDIWSLGVTLYNLLTGSFPFPASSIIELSRAILEASPAPLRDRSPGVPGGLEAAIARCLCKDPALRFASVAELSASLSAFAAPEAGAYADRVARIQRSAQRRREASRVGARASGGPSKLAPSEPAPPCAEDAGVLGTGALGADPGGRASIVDAPSERPESKSLGGTVTPVRSGRLEARGSGARGALRIALLVIGATVGAFGTAVWVGIQVMRRDEPEVAQPMVAPWEVASAKPSSEPAAARPSGGPAAPDASVGPAGSGSAGVAPRAPVTGAPTARSSRAMPPQLPAPAPRVAPGLVTKGKRLFKTMD
jgi:serine/threonine-protein kinase